MTKKKFKKAVTVLLSAIMLFNVCTSDTKVSADKYDDENIQIVYNPNLEIDEIEINPSDNNAGHKESFKQPPKVEIDNDEDTNILNNARTWDGGVAEGYLPGTSTAEKYDVTIPAGFIFQAMLVQP